MKIRVMQCTAALAVLLAAPLFAQSEESKPAASPAAAAGPGGMSEAEMMQAMVEMSKTNENHKLLASMDGKWNYSIKFWMAGPDSKPEESSGTAMRESVMGGRYVVMDVNGKMKMPGPDGKMQDFDFKGRGTDGYDNAKKKFISSWIDNLGTGIMMAEGTYDPATKTFTFTGDYQPMPGQVQKVKSIWKVTDKDHMTFEMFDLRDGKEIKTTEIAYTRAK